MSDDSEKDDGVLDYFPPRDDEEIKRRERARAWAGGVITAVSVWFTVFAFVMSHIPIGGVASPTNLLSVVEAFIALGVVIGAPAVIYWRRQSRGFATGALIGLGVALLVEGICFAALH